MADLVACAVCGEPSTREDWKNKFTAGGKSLVACDSHSSGEIEEVKKKLDAAAAPAK
jgi:hypothetical protein